MLDSALVVLIALAVVAVAAHVVPWVVDPHGMRDVPGPRLAAFSDLWLARVAALGHRSEVVHRLHERYGPLVRIAPNHISVADPAALQIVYAHGNGSLKSDFYDAFVSIHRGLFNTRDRAQHARKRKLVAHVFAPASVRAFEPHIQLHIRELAGQWDRLCAAGARGEHGADADGWAGREGRVWLDCLPWLNFLAFDIIGRLAFGRPFGMLAVARDLAPVALSAQHAISSYGQAAEEKEARGGVASIPAVKILNERGEFSAALGVQPPHWRTHAKRFLPWFRQGNRAVQQLAGLAVMAVKARLEAEGADGKDRNIGDGEGADLLAKLMQGKDDEGRPMGHEELTAEALTQLIAGSDTTSNSSCAISYYLGKHPATQRALQAALDEALGPLDAHEDAAVQYDAVKGIAYLDAVINEGLRLHSTSGIGLPRIVPEGAPMAIGDHAFPPGAILSVPSYTIHRDAAVWGPDPEAFRPERWLEGNREELLKGFNPFSYGPRACVGKNLANMELFLIIASLFRRYDFVLEDPDVKFETREGFLRKPVRCQVGIKRRV